MLLKSICAPVPLVRCPAFGLRTSAKVGRSTIQRFQPSSQHVRTTSVLVMSRKSLKSNTAVVTESVPLKGADVATAASAAFIGIALYFLLTRDASAMEEVNGAAIQLYDVAEGGGDPSFLSNVTRYGRFFVTVMIGTGYVFIKPVAALFKNPVTGVLGTVGLVGGGIATKYLLELMLGLESDTYLDMPSGMIGF